MTRLIITLPDGYNGHTEQFDSTPIGVQGTTLKLRHANKPWLIRWVDIEQYIDAVTKTRAEQAA